MIILGISCYYHDAAAALIVDGQLTAAAEEERFSRLKHDSSFPQKAIDFCLKQANIGAQDIDWIVFYEKPFVKFERMNLTFLATVPRTRSMFVHGYKTWLADKLWISLKIAQHLGVKTDKIVFAGHHLSHAASSFYTSPFSSAAILTCDGVGEWTTTSWGKGKDNTITLQQEIRFPHSLGLFYSVFTQYLGFTINEGEYKVMGLAPYGKPKYKELIEKLTSQANDGSYTLDMSYFSYHISEKISYSKKLIQLLPAPPRDPGKSDRVVPVYADLAASAQQVLEEKLLTIAKHVRRVTGEDNLCYAGGVALNGVANWRIFKEAGFKNVFIHPAAGDSGGALGAALYVYHHILGKPRQWQFSHAYWGQQNSQSDIKAFLREYAIGSRALTQSQLIDRVVSLLANGKVVGWVQGRFEWGPRALGARSILADPRRKDMKQRVNAKIKFREGFRPFAPSTLYEKGNKYFAVGNHFPQLLEYMLAVVPVVPEHRQNLGAITHVDGTARPQFVRQEINPLYHRLISQFGQKTGTPVVLNTSFNLKGEPIVNTCQEAYQTFIRSGIDALVLENYLIEKDRYW